MRIIPELYLSIGVQFRVVFHSFHGNSDGAGARVSAEFVVSLPRNEQSHLEGASIDNRPKVLQHQQNKCLEQRRSPHLSVLSPPISLIKSVAAISVFKRQLRPGFNACEKSARNAPHLISRPNG